MTIWRILCRSQAVGLKCFELLQLYWLASFLKHASGALDSRAMWFAWAASSQFVPENPLESASRDQSWTVLVSPHVFSFPPGEWPHEKTSVKSQVGSQGCQPCHESCSFSMMAIHMVSLQVDQLRRFNHLRYIDQLDPLGFPGGRLSKMGAFNLSVC